MKFRIITTRGEGLGLGLKLAREGHKVDFWMKGNTPIYKGILPRAEAWNVGLTPQTIVIFDGPGHGGFADTLKKDGMPIYGSGKLNDAIEKNAEFSMQFASKMAKMKMPAWGRFAKYEDAEDFIKRTNKVWVYKKEGFTYVPRDREDCLSMLGYFAGIFKDQFILQEKIEGIEVTVEQNYLDGEPVAGSLNSSVTENRLFDGDRGPLSGFMGSLCWFWQKLQPKIYRLTLQKVEPFLKKFHFCGPLTVKCIVSQKDMLPYFTGFRAHFRYGNIYALCEVMETSLGDLLSCLAVGRNFEIKRNFRWCGVVRVTVPPYPYAGKPNLPIKGLDEHSAIMGCRVDGNNLVTAGMTGVVCDVCGAAKTIPALDRVLNKRLDSISIADKQHRVDVVKSARKKIGQLKKWKYFADK